MKIRSGFVSNSSSSSFVILGAKMSVEELESMLGKDFCDALYKDNLECIYAEDYDGTDGYYIGKKIMSGHSEEGGLDKGGIFSMAELQQIAKDLERLGKEIKLIGGMRSS